MEIVKVVLLAITGLGVTGFLTAWAQAYQKVENIEKWPKQMSALQPWWFLDSKLLSKEYEYLRFRAARFFVLYVASLLALWWLS